MSDTDSAWELAKAGTLSQGDYLPGCLVPAIPDDFGEAAGEIQLLTATRNLVILTQSCDLDDGGTTFVLLCQASTLIEFEGVAPGFKKNKWRDLSKNRMPSLVALPPLEASENEDDSLICDFRVLCSLPIGYVRRRADATVNRLSLRSPYREHLAKRFGDCFSRIALPDTASSLTL